MSQNKEIPLSRCRSSAAVNLQQKEKGGISTILCLSCCSKEWIGLSTKYAHYPFYARGNLAIRWHDLLSIKSLYRLARVHFPDAAHQHHPVKGWPASPASLLQPRPSPRTMVHLPGGLPTQQTHQILHPSPLMGHPQNIQKKKVDIFFIFMGTLELWWKWQRQRSILVPRKNFHRKILRSARRSKFKVKKLQYAGYKRSLQV